MIFSNFIIPLVLQLGTHCYFFKVYALDTLLDLPSITKKLELEKAMNDIVGYGELIVLYKIMQMKITFSNINFFYFFYSYFIRIADDKQS